MIWFFLAGMIAGAVGMIMAAEWWMRTHSRKLTLEEFEAEVKELQKEDNDGLRS